MGVNEIKSKLFGNVDYVCGGHGARWTSDGKFTIPNGITIKFYCRDGDPLGNERGKAVDQIVNGGAAPGGARTRRTGQQCWDYRLFNHRSGLYLNLGMRSQANERYIQTSNNDQGVRLSAICNTIIRATPNATIHWSACRVIEADNSHFDLEDPVYDGVLAALSKRAFA